MVGNYLENFNTLATANQLRAASTDFAQLPWQNSDLTLANGQALFFYGGRTALLDALGQLDEFHRITADRWKQMALFRAKRKVAGGTKTKQLLMLAAVGDQGIPASLQNLVIPLDHPNSDTADSIRIRKLKQIINGL